MWYEPGNIFAIRQMGNFEAFGFAFWNILAIITVWKIWPGIVETARIVERERLLITHHFTQHFGRGGGPLTYTRHGNPVQSILLFCYLSFSTHWLFEHPTISLAFATGAIVTFLIWQWLFFSAMIRDRARPKTRGGFGSSPFNPTNPFSGFGGGGNLPPGLTREPVEPSSGYSDDYRPSSERSRKRK